MIIFCSKWIYKKKQEENPLEDLDKVCTITDFLVYIRRKNKINVEICQKNHYESSRWISKCTVLKLFRQNVAFLKNPKGILSVNRNLGTFFLWVFFYPNCQILENTRGFFSVNRNLRTLFVEFFLSKLL